MRRDYIVMFRGSLYKYEHLIKIGAPDIILRNRLLLTHEIWHRLVRQKQQHKVLAEDKLYYWLIIQPRWLKIEKEVRNTTHVIFCSEFTVLF